ncbi:hypothetical protein [Streptomyces kronopolitis]|uniref:hypothetical protein n=1 Tax=Streptomyces kronopolitis TaxID=1612435 RepID=UPI0034482C34
MSVSAFGPSFVTVLCMRLMPLGGGSCDPREEPPPNTFYVFLPLYDEIEQDPFLGAFNDRVMRDLRGGGARIGFESDGDICGMRLPVQQAGGTFVRESIPLIVTAGARRTSSRPASCSPP